jgi:hypothetical protein
MGLASSSGRGYGSWALKGASQVILLVFDARQDFHSVYVCLLSSTFGFVAFDLSGALQEMGSLWNSHPQDGP